MQRALTCQVVLAVAVVGTRFSVSRTPAGSTVAVPNDPTNQARALVMLVSRASIFLSRTPKIGETYFCDTEEEARRWLDTRRVPPSAPAPPSS